MARANILELVPAESGDRIVAALRAIADGIAEETMDDERTTAVLVIEVGERGTMLMHGLGATNAVHMLGLLTMAAARLV